MQIIIHEFEINLWHYFSVQVILKMKMNSPEVLKMNFDFQYWKSLLRITFVMFSWKRYFDLQSLIKFNITKNLLCNNFVVMNHDIRNHFQTSGKLFLVTTLKNYINNEWSSSSREFLSKYTKIISSCLFNATYYSEYSSKLTTCTL